MATGSDPPPRGLPRPPGGLRVFQEDVKTFITLENLEQRIEEALDRPRNYNYAIDHEGRVVKRTVLE